MSAVEPGWYEDPEDPRRWRWWDGDRWTAHTSDDLDDDANADAASPDERDDAPPLGADEPPPGPERLADDDRPPDPNQLDDEHTTVLGDDPPTVNDGQPGPLRAPAATAGPNARTDLGPQGGGLDHGPPTEEPELGPPLDEPDLGPPPPRPADQKASSSPPLASPGFLALLVAVVLAGLAIGFFVVG